MPDKNCVGLGPYAPAGSGSAPQRLFAKLFEKSRLRAALSAVQAEIDAALPALNPGEITELQRLIAGEVAAADIDVRMMQQQIAQEEALAASTKAMDVRLTREASRILHVEMMRQIEPLGGL